MRFFVCISLALGFVTSAQAGLILDSITGSELEGIHNDLTGLTLFTTGSHGNTVDTGWSGDFGVMGGVGRVRNLDSLVSDTSAENTIPLLLPNMFFVGSLSTPIGLSFDINWRPDIWQIEGLHTRLLGAGLRFAVSLGPINIEPAISYTSGIFEFDQTINSTKSNIDIDRRITTAGLTLGFQASWFVPYIHAGYAQSDLTIDATNSTEVFDSTLSLDSSVDNTVEGYYGRVGFSVRLPAANLGIEYQNGFGNDRILIKIASGGNDAGFGIGF